MQPKPILQKSMLKPPAKRQMRANFKSIDNSDLSLIESSLRRNYFAGRFPEDYLSTEWGKNDLANHLTRRLDTNRETVTPWLDRARELRNSSILEIGCGTGSSTVAFAEQGANVVAIDVDKNSLSVAVERCKAYGVAASFVQTNATEVKKLFSDRHFDFIIFYAALEHMTYEERMVAMRSTWQMLSRGGLWCVVETPNRLWYYDEHTSFMPFHMWLPDKLAFEYSRFSPRENYRELYRNYTDESRLQFLRRGRGVSFHEFELTMKPLESLKIVSSLKMRDRYRDRGLSGLVKWRRSPARKYISLLREIAPEVDDGFLQDFLYLIIEKD